MPHLRPYRAADRDRVAEICVRTALSGDDATGVLSDDAIWPAIFVLPYVDRHPEFAFVVDDETHGVVGYVVGAPDTRDFEEWFRADWWPRQSAEWPEPAVEATREDGVLIYAYGRGPGVEPYGDQYPAHLHIDLLPEAQGQGWGRRLIDALAEALRDAGVSGLHLVSAADNAPALAFYRHLGLVELDSHPGVQAFGLALDASTSTPG